MLKQGIATKLVFFFGALGGMLFGYDQGVMSGALLFLRNDIPLSNFMEGLVVSALLIGAVVGAGFSGYLSDRWGRRRTILVISVLYIVGALGSAYSGSALHMIISRIIIGLGVGGSTAIVPVYLSEMAPTEIRGKLGSLNQFMVTVGILLSYIINYLLAPAEAWRWMLGMAAFPAVLLLIGIMFMPESPRWLIKQHLEEEALKVMRVIRKDYEIEPEIKEIKKVETAGSQGALALLKEKWVRPMLLIGIGLGVFQQIIGINAVIYYAPTIFSKAGLANSASLLGTIGIGVVNVAMTVIAIMTIDKLGRKKLLMWGNIGMSGSLIILAYILFTSGLTISTAWFTIVLLGCYIVFFAATWGPAVWVLLPELFPLNARGAGTGISTLFMQLANLIVALLFPVLLASIGIAWLFVIFAGIGALAFLFVVLFVPETKGRSLESIESDLKAKSFSVVTPKTLLEGGE